MKYFDVDAGGLVVSIYSRPQRADQPSHADVHIGDLWDGTTLIPGLRGGPTLQEQRDIDLSNIVHDFGDGRVMQCRPQDEQNLRLAIERMEANAVTTKQWVMVDNKKYAVTLTELKTARDSGITQGDAIWDAYNP